MGAALPGVLKVYSMEGVPGIYPSHLETFLEESFSKNGVLDCRSRSSPVLKSPTTTAGTFNKASEKLCSFRTSLAINDEEKSFLRKLYPAEWRPQGNLRGRMLTFNTRG